jgi:hypothetical protein
MPKKTEQISKITFEQRPFLIDEIELKPRFFVRYREQVDQAQVWMLYRDGLFKKQLQPGLHKWWSRLFHKWRVQKINKRVEILPVDVKSRVKGPSMPSEVAGGTTYELACDVITNLEITCKIKEIENFIQYSKPISVFCNAIQDMVFEYVGRLSYDQYGQWATEIRNWTKECLGPRGRFDAERRVGLTVEDVFVKDFEPYTEHDAEVLDMYKKIEKGKRELAAVQSYAKRGIVVAESLAKQGETLNIFPSILALQNSPIGRALIGHDAELRRLMVATGINPSISVTQQQDTMGQSDSRQTSSLGYLNPPRLPVAGQLPNGPTSAQEVTGQIFPVDLPGATHPFSSSTQDTLKDTDDSYVDVARQELELTELGREGFQVAGRGKPVPTYDAAGQPVPGSKAWELTVSQRRATGYLAMKFHCPPGYPNTAPSLRVQSPMGGGYQSMFPNTIHEWNAGRRLADVAREIADSNP